MKEKETKKKKESRKGWIVYIMLMVGVILLNTFVVMHSYIRSESMETTLMTGSHVLYSRLDTKEIHRGDIIVFKHEGEHWTKRVIGLPGEVVVVSKGKVTINGEELKENYLHEAMDTSGDGTFKVPEDCYFVLGDNRNESFDSRYWKNPYVKHADIEGKFWKQIWPL